MKKLLLIIPVLLLFTEVLATSDSLYQSALRHYEDNNFEEALDICREINNRGLESHVLYYNMGNAAYRSNQLGWAILYFEKALKLDPGFEEASSNLQFVNQFKADRFEEVPEFFIRKWHRTFINIMPASIWGILSVILFSLLLAGILLFTFSRKLFIKKAGFYVSIITLFLSLISISASRKQHSKIIEPESGIIIYPSVVVKSTPSDTGNELFILHEGTKFVIGEEVSDWLNIKIIDGRTGWIQETECASI